MKFMRILFFTFLMFQCQMASALVFHLNEQQTREFNELRDKIQSLKSKFYKGDIIRTPAECEAYEKSVDLGLLLDIHLADIAVLSHVTNDQFAKFGHQQQGQKIMAHSLLMECLLHGRVFSFCEIIKRTKIPPEQLLSFATSSGIAEPYFEKWNDLKTNIRGEYCKNFEVAQQVRYKRTCKLLEKIFLDYENDIKALENINLIWWASHFQHVPLLRALLKKGAYPAYTESRGSTALSLALTNPHDPKRSRAIAHYLLLDGRITEFQHCEALFDYFAVLITDMRFYNQPEKAAEIRQFMDVFPQFYETCTSREKQKISRRCLGTLFPLFNLLDLTQNCRVTGTTVLGFVIDYVLDHKALSKYMREWEGAKTFNQELVYAWMKDRMKSLDSEATCFSELVDSFIYWAETKKNYQSDAGREAIQERMNVLARLSLNEGEKLEIEHKFVALLPKLYGFISNEAESNQLCFAATSVPFSVKVFKFVVNMIQNRKALQGFLSNYKDKGVTNFETICLGYVKHRLSHLPGDIPFDIQLEDSQLEEQSEPDEDSEFEENNPAQKSNVFSQKPYVESTLWDNICFNYPERSKILTQDLNNLYVEKNAVLSPEAFMLVTYRLITSDKIELLEAFMNRDRPTHQHAKAFKYKLRILLEAIVQSIFEDCVGSGLYDYWVNNPTDWTGEKMVANLKNWMAKFKRVTGLELYTIPDSCLEKFANMKEKKEIPDSSAIYSAYLNEKKLVDLCVTCYKKQGIRWMDDI